MTLEIRAPVGLKAPKTARALSLRSKIKKAPLINRDAFLLVLLLVFLLESSQ